MPVSRAFGESVGSFIRNLRNPRWIAAEATKQSVGIWVINPYGKKAKAWIKAHLHIHDVDRQGRIIKAHHVADAYECEDGHEYLHYDGKTYAYNRESDTWSAA